MHLAAFLTTCSLRRNNIIGRIPLFCVQALKDKDKEEENRGKLLRKGR